MNVSNPATGIAFLIALAVITAGAGYYTLTLPKKGTCPATPLSYSVNATAHQWGFLINGTDATKNGWSICHGSTVTFHLIGSWEHDPVSGVNYTTHGFQILGIMNDAQYVHPNEVVNFTVTFTNPGTYTLQCTFFCGELPGVGGHSTMRATLTVLP